MKLYALSLKHAHVNLVETLLGLHFPIQTLVWAEHHPLGMSRWMCSWIF